MADVKISELTALTSPDGAEELVVNDGGTTKKITITNATSASLPKSGGTMTGPVVLNTSGDSNGSKGLEINTSGTNFESDAGIIQVTHAASGATTGGYFMKLKAGGADKFTVKGNGDVNAGTVTADGVVDVNTGSGTSPSYFNSFLNVQNNASTGDNSSLTITAGNAGYAGLHFGDAENGRIGQVAYSNADNALLFTANNSERMRIDSSGNVLVGKTSPTISTAGVELRPNGQLFATQSGNYPLLLNRTTNDGAIAEFRKDGTTVGSIGTTAGEITAGSGSTGMRFTDAATRIDPWDISSNSASDGLIDFGTGARRFKDAYLSGGLYLGGVGSSNKLDDYETGSWTPVVSGGTLSISIARASYVKAGSLVYVQCYITGSSGGDATTMALTGLPFTVVSNGWALGSVNYNDTAVTNPQARAGQSSTRVEFKKNGDNNMTQTELNGGHIIFSITYEAA